MNDETEKESHRRAELVAVIDAMPQGAARNVGDYYLNWTRSNTVLVAIAVCHMLEGDNFNEPDEYALATTHECRVNPVQAVRRRLASSWPKERPAVIRAAQKKYGALAKARL